MTPSKVLVWAIGGLIIPCGGLFLMPIVTYHSIRFLRDDDIGNERGYPIAALAIVAMWVLAVAFAVLNYRSRY